MPKVSVIIPVYNTEKYLRQCLDSVINQTLEDIEIICVDDGSTDSSLDILKEYAEKDHRIKIIEQKNQFAGVARNVAAKIATGEYLGFVDSDDKIDLDFFEKLYNKAIKNNSDIVKGNYIVCNVDGSVTKTKENDKITEEINEVKIPYSSFCTSWWSAIYKKSLIDKYNIEFAPIKYLEDVPFLYKSIAVAESFSIVDNVYYHYVIHNNSTSHKQLPLEKLLQKYDDFFTSRENVLEFLNRVDLSEDKYLMLFDEKVYKTSLFNLKNIMKENKVDDIVRYIKRIENMIQGCKYNFYEFKTTEELLSLKLKNYSQFLRQISKNNNAKIKIPVAIAGDDNFAIGIATCLYSILKNTNSFIEIFVLSDNISLKNQDKIRKSLKKFKNFNLNYIEMDEFCIKDLPENSTFSYSAYSRFFIPEICKEYNKVIYTDADVIFCDDIKKYYEIDLEGYGIAAINAELGAEREGEGNYKLRKEILGIPQEHCYFASGNLIIDCNYWRKNQIISKLLNEIKNNEDRLLLPDNDVFNVVFKTNNYKKIHYKYCCCTHRYNCTDGNKEMLEAFNEPFIIHYSALPKPWCSSEVVFHKEFMQVLKNTDFKQEYKKKSKRKKYLQNIFSIKNTQDKRHKVITFLGLKFKIKNKLQKLNSSVYIFDENSETELKYIKELPQNIKIFGGDKSNIIKLHKKLISRNVVITFTDFAKNSLCILDDSTGSTGLDIIVHFLDGDGSELKIGKSAEMNGTKIWLGNGSKCHIGNDCLFSYEIMIRTTDGHAILDNKTQEIINNQKKDCIIGDNCWIGLRSVINKNVQLAHNTIVGSGSVITKQFEEPYTIIAGNPAKIIKRGVKHDRRTIYQYNNNLKSS